MATHEETRWPPVGTFSGRRRGDFHGRRQRLLVDVDNSGLLTLKSCDLDRVVALELGDDPYRPP
jgi:hypothetical protein